jgi:magnesium and cobalt transporter
MRTMHLIKNKFASLIKKITKIFKSDPDTKEQLITLLRSSHNKAIINDETLSMIEGAFLFAQMQVRDIMLPKNQMICLDKNMGIDEIIQIVTDSGHSRFPVIAETNDSIMGVLHAKDLLIFQKDKTKDFDLIDLVRETNIVPESKKLDLLLHDFRTNRNHMAIVVDEYGIVSGFVTLEDLIEQIIGEIVDEFDIDEESYIKTHLNDHYIIKAHTPIEDFNAHMHAHFKNEEYETIGGIVLAHLGYLPKRGETTIIDDFEFKIVHADSRRINLLECIDKRTRLNHA